MRRAILVSSSYFAFVIGIQISLSDVNVGVDVEVDVQTDVLIDVQTDVLIDVQTHFVTDG